jgi:hypothetical protein
MVLTDESNKEKLKNWLIELVSLFREEFEKLSPREREVAFGSLLDLSEPCQFLVIWAKDPEFQIVFIVRSNNLEDKLIEIYGPIENYKLIEFIENEVLKSRIVEIIGKEKVEASLVTALRNIRSLFDPLMGTSKSLFGGRWRIYTNTSLDTPYSVCWIVKGNLQDFNIKELVVNFIEEIKSAAKPSPPPSPPSPTIAEKIILKGFGTYVYPPIWIGKNLQSISFKEKVMGGSFLANLEKDRIIETYKNRPLVIRKDGYIAIGETNKWKAHELLNEIMSVLLIRGVPTNVIRECDLGEATITETGGSYSWNPLSSRVLLYEQQYIYDYNFYLLGRTLISEEDMRKAIKLAELLTSDDKIKTLLLLFLEAYTYFQNTEYKQSLIIAWVILEEFYIEDLWLQHISKITSDERRLNKLKNWTVDQRLEALHISHVLTDEEYSLLMKIKEARNEAVHEGKMPQKDIVEKCLNLVFRVVQRYIGTYVGTKIHEL